MSNNLTWTNKLSIILENIIYFGKNLNFLREKKGLTLQQIADILGFSRSQWNNYECNTSYPKFLDLVKISKYFDISESDLIHRNIKDDGITVPKIEKQPTPKDLIELLEERRYTIELQREKISFLEKKLEQKKQYPETEINIKPVAEENPPKLNK